MDKIILYTTGCPQCRVLEQKLNNANITFEVSEDIDVIKEKGFMTAPVLEVGDNFMNFSTALHWINNM